MSSDTISATISALQIPAKDDIEKGASSALAMVDGYSITDDDSYQLAGEELMSIKSKAKKLEEQRTAITGPLNAATKAVNDLFRGPAEMLSRAESIVKTAMIGYSNKVAADRKAAEQAAAEALAKAAEQARAAEKQAEQELAAGNAEAAEASIQKAAEAQMTAALSVPVVAPIAKVAGISKVRVTNKARVTDMGALVAHAASDPNALAVLLVDQTKLNQLAKALGKNLNWPGVEVYEDQSIAARAA